MLLRARFVDWGEDATCSIDTRNPDFEVARVNVDEDIRLRYVHKGGKIKIKMASRKTSSLVCCKWKKCGRLHIPDFQNLMVLTRF